MNIKEKQLITRIRDMVAYNTVSHMTHRERNQHLRDVIRLLNEAMVHSDTYPHDDGLPF